MTTHEDRVQQAGEMIADASEGLLVGLDLSLAITLIVGWTDLRPSDIAPADWTGCCEQYRLLAGHLQSIRESNE